MRSDPVLPLPVDFEPEGLDLPGRHFADGVSQSGHEPNSTFLNLGPRGFADVSGVSGLDDAADGRSLAWLDFDRDGWLDAAVVNANAPLLQLFRNEIGDGQPGPPRHFIAIAFEGANRSPAPAPGRSPRDGIGARVSVRLGDETLHRELRAGEGLGAQNAPRLLIGIGEHTAAEAVEVRWPSGRTQTLEDVAAGTLLTVFEDPSQSAAGTAAERVPYAAVAARTTAAAGTDDTPRIEAPAGAPPTGLRVFTTLATWCEPCRDELPQLRDLREAFPPGELALYGVPVDDTDTPEKLARWQRRHRPAYVLVEDAPPAWLEAVRAQVLRGLGFDALPASVVTDGSGRVLATLAGAPTISDLVALAGSLGAGR